MKHDNDIKRKEVPNSNGLGNEGTSKKKKAYHSKNLTRRINLRLSVTTEENLGTLHMISRK